MTPYIEELITRCHRLVAATNHIRNEYQNSVNRLEELEQSMPQLIAAVALVPRNI